MLFVSDGGVGGGKGGKYKPKSMLSLLSGARGSSCSGLGLGLGDGEGGGRTCRGEGMRRHSGDTGLSTGEWAGVVSADSTDGGAVGVQCALAMVDRNFGYHEQVGDWIIGDSMVPHEVQLSNQQMGHFSKTWLL